MTTEITLTADEAEDVIYNSANIVRDRITEHKRWCVVHELIFKRNDKLYRLIYKIGATEREEQHPFDEAETIKCKEVFEVPSVDYK